jgi:hypothetical protein
MAASPEPEGLPGLPSPGSASAFAWLYFPAGRRREFALLLALEAEIGAGLARRLDHALAHARLEFWGEEAARHAAGAARHPWLRAGASGAAAPAWNLGALVHAALIDLAEARQAPPLARRLRGAVFCAAAALLDAPPPDPAALESLRALGALSAELERPPGGASPPSYATARARLGRAIAQLDPPQQRHWVPLLVWCAIDARRAARAERHSRLAAFADNIAAWRAARAAAAGALRIG